MTHRALPTVAPTGPTAGPTATPIAGPAAAPAVGPIVALVLLAAALGAGPTVAQETRPASTQAASDELGVVISTEKGDIILDFFEEDAPVTVASFVNLAQRGFYDGLVFHRVIPDFMIQGGDPQGTGAGGPGYVIEDETTPARKHDAPGVLSMAKKPAPHTGGSQFFITHVPTPHLDGKHTVFGEVVRGQDVVDSIVKGDVMKKVTITGDASELLAEQAERVAEWNAILDADTPDEKRAAVEAMESAAAKRMAEKNAEDDARQLAQALETVQTLGADPAKGQSTDFGIWLHVLNAGEGEKATPQDSVTAHATGLLADGTKFWSSHDSGQPITQHPVQRFVPGFTEALQYLAPGGEAVVIIPGRLGYGEGGNPRAGIPGNATLVFKIELLDVH